MSAYTPGPWTLIEGYVVDTTNTVIPISGIAQPHGYVPDNNVSWANARLIAAAPELLQKLRDADQLIMKLATVIIKEQVMDHVPFGLQETCREWLRDGATGTLAKAEGRA